VCSVVVINDYQPRASTDAVTTTAIDRIRKSEDEVGYEVVIPMGEIQSINVFDKEVYAEHFKSKGATGNGSPSQTSVGTASWQYISVGRCCLLDDNTMPQQQEIRLYRF
jgi:hypothetical protein